MWWKSLSGSQRAHQSQQRTTGAEDLHARAPHLFQFKQVCATVWFWKCCKDTLEVKMMITHFLQAKQRKDFHKNLHASAGHLQREQPWWGSSSTTEWLTNWLSHTRMRAHTYTYFQTFTVVPLRHFTVHTPLYMHSPFLSLTAPHLCVCFLLNPYFPQPQTALKIKMALI